jgi:hypothetical protein
MAEPPRLRCSRRGGRKDVLARIGSPTTPIRDAGSADGPAIVHSGRTPADSEWVALRRGPCRREGRREDVEKGLTLGIPGTGRNRRPGRPG